MAGDGVSVPLEVDAKQAKDELKGFEGVLKGFAGKATAAISGFAAGFAGAFSFGAIKDVIANTVHYGSTIQDLSERFHISTDAVQRYKLAAEQSGTSLEAFSKAFQKLEVNKAKALGGDTSSIQKFKDVGITLDELRGQSEQGTFDAVARSGADAAESVALLGKNALELRPLFEAIQSGTANLNSNVISAENIARLDQMEDLYLALSQAAKVFAGTIIGEVIPAIGKLQDIGAKPMEAVTRLFGGKDTAGIPQGADASPEDTALAAQLRGMREREEAEGISVPDAGEAPEAAKEKKKLGFFDLDEDEQKESIKDELDVIGEDTKAKVDSAKDAADEREQAAKDAVDAPVEAAKLAKKQNDVRRAAEKEQFGGGTAANPNQLTLSDLATAPNSIGNAQAAKAKEALREEKESREAQIRGDLRGAQQHKSRAEALKKELGLKEPKDEFKAALDESEILRKIEKNTGGGPANK